MHAHHIQTPESARQIPIQVQFTANVWQEGDWFVAQCKEVEVARQGRTEKEALDNLREAFYLKASWLPQTQKRAKGKRRSSASLKKRQVFRQDMETILSRAIVKWQKMKFVRLKHRSGQR